MCDFELLNSNQNIRSMYSESTADINCKSCPRIVGSEQVYLSRCTYLSIAVNNPCRLLQIMTFRGQQHREGSFAQAPGSTPPTYTSQLPLICCHNLLHHTLKANLPAMKLEGERCEKEKSPLPSSFSAFCFSKCPRSYSLVLTRFYH